MNLGDKIICIDNQGCNGITIGNHYLAHSIIGEFIENVNGLLNEPVNEPEECVVIVDDNFVAKLYATRRFLTIREYNLNQLV